jgi:hypothetical protein
MGISKGFKNIMLDILLIVWGVVNINDILKTGGGMHCATSWKVAGSRPNEVNDFIVYLILQAALGSGVYSIS